MKGKEFLIPPKSEVMATVGHTCPHAVENLNELFHARRFFFHLEIVECFPRIRRKFE